MWDGNVTVTASRPKALVEREPMWDGNSMSMDMYPLLKFC